MTARVRFIRGGLHSVVAFLVPGVGKKETRVRGFGWCPSVLLHLAVMVC